MCRTLHSILYSAFVFPDAANALNDKILIVSVAATAVKLLNANAFMSVHTCNIHTIIYQDIYINKLCVYKQVIY